jgi:hypothetical protein
MGLLAEQIYIECPPARMAELFCHQPATWMAPLLRLAGDEGEATGLALLGRAADAGARPRHGIDVGSAPPGDGNARFSLRWQTGDYRVLFRTFVGTLEVRPLMEHSVVSVEGRFTAEVATMAARRAAESAVRSLLGHLRSAVEESSPSVR